MFKRFCLFLFLFFLITEVSFAENTMLLTGFVSYTVESAKRIAFDGIEKKLDKAKILPYRVDSNNKENQYVLKNGLRLKDRTVMSFQMYNEKINGYVVIYHDSPEYAYYYTSGGYLVAIDLDDKFKENIFPYKIGKYSPLTGNLISVALYVSDDEQYAYTKNGKLKAHWVGSIGYNEKGKIIAKRSIVNEIPEY